MKINKFNIGLELIGVWFLLAIIFLFAGVFESYPNLLLIYYLSWFPVLIISGLMIEKSKEK